MRNMILGIGLMGSAALLSSCVTGTSTYSTQTTYVPEYNGYTVGYGYNNGYLGNGYYGGYGGWASSYYAPGYRYGGWSRGYSQGASRYYSNTYIGRGGYAGHGAYAGHGGRR